MNIPHVFASGNSQMPADGAAPAAHGGHGLVSSINKVKTGFKTDICFTVPVGDHSGSKQLDRAARAIAFVTVKIASPDGKSKRDVIDALQGALVRALAEGFDRD